MKIFLGADHRGYTLKEHLASHLMAISGQQITDFGAMNYDAEDDFNDYAKAVAKAVLASEEPDSFGILICGSAQGVCMQANRFKGIRAAICYSADDATLTRQHNNANVLCLSANNYNPEDPDSLKSYIEIAKAFVTTQALTDEKYQRRNQKLDED